MLLQCRGHKLKQYTNNKSIHLLLSELELYFHQEFLFFIIELPCISCYHFMIQQFQGISPVL